MFKYFDEIVLKLCCFEYINYKKTNKNALYYLKWISSVISRGIIKEYIGGWNVSMCMSFEWTKNKNDYIIKMSEILETKIKYKYCNNNDNILYNSILTEYLPKDLTKIVLQYTLNEHHTFIQYISRILNEFIIYHCCITKNYDIITYIVNSTPKLFNKIINKNGYNAFGICLLYSVFKSDIDTLYKYYTQYFNHENVKIISNLNKIEMSIFKDLF